MPVPDPRLDASAARPPLNHAVGVLLSHGVTGQLAGLVGRRAEYRPVPVSGDPAAMCLSKSRSRLW